MNKKVISYLTLAILSLPAYTACLDSFPKTVDSDPPYTIGKSIAEVQSPALNEISGVVESRINSGCFWVHNDSGDKSQIYLINLSGELVATLLVDGVNRDWEDITLGDGYIYVGEIGDNRAVYPNKKVYRIREPKLNTEKLGQVIEAEDVEVMTFNFADRQRDCETLMFDPLTKKLVFVTKREYNILLYSTEFTPNSGGEIIELTPEATLRITQATGGDISSDGDKILIKNYGKIYYWLRANGEALSEVLAKDPVDLLYNPEPQGEAICWGEGDDHFFTISEKSKGDKVEIFRYDRR